MRKRMIDPHIWETAYDKGWTSDDLTVMLAAISSADDEGFGRLSMIKRNVFSIISDRKMKKSLENLNNSVVILAKIYFFLPNWLEYQKISHPSPSKIKKLSVINNSDLVKYSSGIIHGTASKKSFTSKVKLKEVSLKEVKLSEVRGNEETFSENFELVKNLFQEHTKIVNPNQQTHIDPVLKFFEHIPQQLTESDIVISLQSVFTKLSKFDGLRMDFLLDNIQQDISAKHEKILYDLKEDEQEKAEIIDVESNSISQRQKDNGCNGNSSEAETMLQDVTALFEEQKFKLSHSQYNEVKSLIDKEKHLSAQIKLFKYLNLTVP